MEKRPMGRPALVNKTTLVGKRFGELTVLEWKGVKNKTKHMWECRCDCGNLTTVREDMLKSGHTKTCGGHTAASGMYRSSEYAIWQSAKQRCENPNVDGYKYYGGRGIKMCERWRESFLNFYEDMGPRPSEHHSIERKNRDGDYEPDNCIWADRIAQANNKSTNVNLTYQGKTQTVAQWARELNMRYQTIQDRLAKNLPIEEVLSTRRLDEIVLTYDGQSLTVKEWSEKINVPTAIIRKRLAKGMSVDKVLASGSLKGWRLEYQGEEISGDELATRVGMSASTLRQRIRLGCTVEEAISLPPDPWAVRRYLAQKKKSG